MNENNKLTKIERVQLPPPAGDAKVYESIRTALAEARRNVVIVVNLAMVGIYWEIDGQITNAIGERAEYGRNLLAYLSERLTKEFGKDFTVRNLQQMHKFYTVFPNAHALRAELTWTHWFASGSVA